MQNNHFNIIMQNTSKFSDDNSKNVFFVRKNKNETKHKKMVKNEINFDAETTTKSICIIYHRHTQTQTQTTYT